LASLILIPSTFPTSGGMSAALRQLSSAMTGMREARVTVASPSRSSAGSGCSRTVTPNYPKLLVGEAPDSPQDLEIPIGAQFDLEDRILLGLQHLLAELFRCVDPDGEGGPGRPRRVETPQPEHRHAELLADQVVQRGRQRPARRRIEPEGGLPAPLDVLDREGILGEMLPIGLEGGEHRFGGLAVDLRRGSLTPSLDSVPVGESHPDGSVVALPPAGNDERMTSAEVQDLGFEAEGAGHCGVHRVKEAE